VSLVLNIFSRAGEGRSFCVKEKKKKKNKFPNSERKEIQNENFFFFYLANDFFFLIFWFISIGFFFYFSTFGALDKDLVRRRPFRSTGLKRMRDNNRNNIFKLLQKQQPAPLFF
jgi:hypothetical protein